MNNKVIALFLSFVALGLLPLNSQAPSALRSSQPKLVSEVSGLIQPVALAASPDGRIFVSEQGGAIRLIRLGTLEPQSWFTLPQGEDTDQPPRFGGIALDPDFPLTPKLYLTAAYTKDDLRYACILVLEEVGNQGTLSWFLLDEVPISKNQDPGRVKVGPDGMIYWAISDDLESTKAQDPTNYLGKILRITPEGKIPENNPIPGSYIYASGFKAPFGMAWSPLNGQFFATDFGPGNYNLKGPGRDEVNIIEPGKNYGFPLIKGAETKAGLVAPLQNSTSARGWATNGAAFVTTGKWQGSFLMAGGMGTELLFRFVFDKQDPRKTLWGEEHLTKQKGPLFDVVTLPDGRFLLLTATAVLEYTP